ncbi:MAG: hypothetical protein PWQ37_848 [Candidatus Petromonas sp.]|jgi:hypothetical protein|nr:hypothetical protein [Candidatus Petromonas sp.]
MKEFIKYFICNIKNIMNCNFVKDRRKFITFIEKYNYIVNYNIK